MNLASERIALLSDRLRLPAELLALAEEAAKGSWSYAEFTEKLLAHSTAAVDRRAEADLQHLAAFPYRKSLDGFDFGFQPSSSEQQVRELAAGASLERHENVLLLGPPGVGKSILAVALGLVACRARHRVRFTTAARMVASLAEAREASPRSPAPGPACCPSTRSASCPSTPPRRRFSSRSSRGVTSMARSCSPRTRASANGPRCSAAMA